MRKYRLALGLLLIMGASLFAWAGLASAHTFKTGDNVTFGQGETINDTLFLAGRNIDVNSEVFGDVFCAGQTVTVSGNIHGDVICAGQTVNVSGDVTGDVRLAGQTVTVGGNVAGNATIASQTFSLESSGKIDGDITIGATDSTLNGPVGRHVAAGSTSLIIANSIGGNVKAGVENLTLTDAANVSGNIEYSSNNEVDRADGAVVGGTVTRSEPSERPAGPQFKIYYGFNFWWFIYWLLALAMITLALSLLFPRSLQVVTNKGMPRPWKPLLVGVLAGFVVPVLLIVLAITVIGIPLAIMIWLGWILLLMLSGPVFAFYIGRLIMRNSNHAFMVALVGSGVLMVALHIPLIGLLAFAAAIWIGTGMLLLEIFDRTPRPVYTLDGTTKSNKTK